MGALSVLSLKKNGLGTKEAGKVLGEMLKVNSVLKELDLSDNRPYSRGDPVGFAQELAAGIKQNEALSVLSLNDNFLYAEGGGLLQLASKATRGSLSSTSGATD
jgi:Ran GTPase-activating protein (RanGAP) involved in mRNA processing and transport